MNWHRWFAWYPTCIVYNDRPNNRDHWRIKWAWMKYVERKYLSDRKIFHYREIGSTWR